MKTVRSVADFATAHPMVIAERALRPHERLAWADRGRVRPHLGPALGRFLFGLYFAGFAVVWMGLAAGITRESFAWEDLFGGGPEDVVSVIFPLFGVPFVVVGLSVAFSAFRSFGGGGRRVYGVTDQRVFALARAGTTTSFEFAAIDDLTVRRHRDGSGDVVFTGTPPVEKEPAGLFGVPDADAVAEEIRAQQRLFARRLRGDTE